MGEGDILKCHIVLFTLNTFAELPLLRNPSVAAAAAAGVLGMLSTQLWSAGNAGTVFVFFRTH